MSTSGSTLDDGWFIVLRPDGVVDAVEGGASVSWLGRTLDDVPDAPDALRRAAAEMLHRSPTARVRRRKVRCAHGARSVDAELLLVEALPLRRVLTNVHEVVVRTLDLFQSQASSNEIALSVDLEGLAVPALLIDREKVAWALSTLVVNALRYARERVTVHVSSDRIERNVIFEVADDGPGIPDHEARWLFEHNPATGKSAGLALLMVRDVVVAHRGEVSVTSVLGRGSIFTMRLPR